MPKVYEALGRTKNDHMKGAMLGIECETEGKNLGRVGGMQYWRAEADGSLRNGIEYVSIPLEPKLLETALKELQKGFKDAKVVLDYSFRCSTHVHINVQDLTEGQLQSMILMYMLYENVFMNYVSDERVANRFCLRFQDAGSLTHQVGQILRDIRRNGLRHAFMNFQQNELKYAAFNLYTLVKYGTLEFRALEGTNDLEHIQTWVQAIIRLRSNAMKWEDPMAMYEEFQRAPGKMANEIFGHAPDKFLKAGWQQQVEEGHSQNMAVFMYM